MKSSVTSSPGSRGRSEKTVPVGLVEWAEEMAGIARERHALQVETRISDADCVFSCRPMALERVFRNLFDNVRRYGGGHLTFAAACTRDRVHFSLTDRGDGALIPDMLSAMNAGVLPKQPCHGAGIGLRICHRLLSLHGGSLRFEAAPSGDCARRYRCRAGESLRRRSELSEAGVPRAVPGSIRGTDEPEGLCIGGKGGALLSASGPARVVFRALWRRPRPDSARRDAGRSSRDPR